MSKSDYEASAARDSEIRPSPPPSDTVRVSLTTPGKNSPPSLELGPEEWATAEELSRLDPQLAGLYRAGLELLSRAGEPGLTYLLAHAGRELSRGVLSLLAGTEASLPEDTAAEIPDNEGNRRTISTILQLPPGHPLVTRWFQLHSTLVRAVHFRQAGPAPREVRDAFTGLSDLLFGRIGPYFATHAQLDAFLRIESPDQSAVGRVRPMLARPVQRQYFFSSLAHPGWLAPLDAAGQFDDTPEITDLGDGKWQLRPWPEGEYLVRVSALEPDRVADILLRVPKSLKNPVVWNLVARAAVALPADRGARLARHLESALRSSSPTWFSMNVIPLVGKLARAEREEALGLAAHLLWLNNPPDPNVQGAVTAGAVYRPPRDTEWVLARLDSYTLGEFLKDAVPALEAFRLGETAALLSKTLERAVWLVEKAGGAGESYLRGSTGWCPWLEGVAPDDDVRAQLAVALAGVATRTAARGEQEAANVLDTLGKYEHEIFQRLRLFVLTAAGRFAQGRLDDVIADSRLIDSPPSEREYASLLRAQFNQASPQAQRLFSYALERGPDPERVKNVLKYREAEPTQEEIGEIVADWQRRRLLWFHEQIPELLRPMAERLGVEPKKPSEEERALNEEGFYIGGVTCVGERSPVPAKELASMTPEAIVSYLETWRPDGASHREGPTIRGLELALAQYAADQPESGATVAGRLKSASPEPGYVSALLGGFKEALEKGRTVPWEQALDLAAFAVARANEVEGESGDSNLAREWRWAAGAAARLIEKGCEGNHIPESHEDTVWAITAEALRSAATWAEGDDSEEYRTFYSVLSTALNTLSGHLVDALIDVALWEFRRKHPGEDGATMRDSTAVTHRLVPLLEEVLGRGGRAGLAAQAMLGHYIPQVLLMARAWTMESAQRLFDGGARCPATRPIWAAYLTRSRFYENVFRDLRPWYVVAADAGTTGEVDQQDRDWSPPRHLAMHVLTAVLWGLAEVGDPDGLVGRTFSNVTVADRSHAYWAVFRGWSDSDSKIDAELTTRLVRFWEWRLDQLEALDDEKERSEEAAGLKWLLAAPHVPAADALRLGRRTLDLIGDKLKDRGSTLWERLAELSESDAGGAYEIAERLIQRALTQDYPYLPFERVAPTLRRALKSDASIKDRAIRLIHTLGERGLFEYGKLLGGDDQPE